MSASFIGRLPKQSAQTIAQGWSEIHQVSLGARLTQRRATTQTQTQTQMQTQTQTQTQHAAQQTILLLDCVAS
jgi:hypothetical protein